MQVRSERIWELQVYQSFFQFIPSLTVFCSDGNIAVILSVFCSDGNISVIHVITLIYFNL